MPDDHFLAPPQVTAMDDQFGTHSHDEVGLHIDPRHRLPAIFTELTLAI